MFMEKKLHSGRRTSASLLGKISVVVLKTLAALLLIALMAVFVTSVSPIYDFCRIEAVQRTGHLQPLSGRR